MQDAGTNYLNAEMPQQQRMLTPDEPSGKALNLLEHTFSYHRPTFEQQQHYTAIRAAAKHFAEVVMDNAPSCPDRSAALRKIREAAMTANAAIALGGISL